MLISGRWPFVCGGRRSARRWGSVGGASRDDVVTGRSGPPSDEVLARRGRRGRRSTEGRGHAERPAVGRSRHRGGRAPSVRREPGGRGPKSPPTGSVQPGRPARPGPASHEGASGAVHRKAPGPGAVVPPGRERTPAEGASQYPRVTKNRRAGEHQSAGLRTPTARRTIRPRTTRAGDGAPAAHPLTGTRAPDLALAGSEAGLFALLDPTAYLLLDLTPDGALGDRARPGLAVRSAVLDGPPAAWAGVRAALVRPDGHVAWAGTDRDDAELSAALDEALATALRRAASDRGQRVAAPEAASIGPVGGRSRPRAQPVSGP
ncbi:hypothetical protein ACFWA9_27255 [Kitasatospora sp. NPDC059973]|uniref:aromatic-ring hydroxylase C-terminal domain-containing protein n=1 Tax=Kitasatospora sp. NPDC059973 TaxID=3347020 RepID=UPI0036C5CA4A